MTLPQLSAAVQELENAMLVVSHQHAQLARNHATAVEWLEALQKQAEQQQKETAALRRETDQRIAELVSAIGEFLRQKK